MLFIGNSEMIPKHMMCSLENPWCCPGVQCSNHTQTNYAPFLRSAFNHFYLLLWAGMDIRGGEWDTVTSGPPFFRNTAGTFWEFCKRFCL